MQRGRQDELLQLYRKAIIQAFADVENALIAVQQGARRERLQREVVAASRRAFEISETRLREGTIDLVTVLNTQQTLFQAEDAAAQARLAHLQAVVSLYQALGGGWIADPTRRLDCRRHHRRLAHDRRPPPSHEIAGMLGRKRRLVALVLRRADHSRRLRGDDGADAAAAGTARAPAAAACGEGPVPVLAVPAKLADVPVYLDGVGTARALTPSRCGRRSTAS